MFVVCELILKMGHNIGEKMKVTNCTGTPVNIPLAGLHHRQKSALSLTVRGVPKIACEY